MRSVLLAGFIALFSLFFCSASYASDYHAKCQMVHKKSSSSDATVCSCTTVNKVGFKYLEFNYRTQNTWCQNVVVYDSNKNECKGCK